jgi:hypothetical protein
MIKFRSPIHIVKSVTFDAHSVATVPDGENTVDIPFDYALTLRIDRVSAVYPYIAVHNDTKKVTVSEKKTTIETDCGTYTVWGSEREVRKKLGL